MKPLKLDEIASAIEGRPLGQPGHYVVDGVSIDSRQARSGELFFAIEGERFDGHSFVASAIDAGAMAAVVSHPDRVPADLHQLGLLLLVDDTAAALGRLAAYHRRQVPATVIAVTGSNGKTTTKEMIHQVLSGRRRGRGAPKSFNNAIGVPLTLLSVEPDDDYVVVEIGSSAPGEVAALARLASPDIGVITSVAETHLEQLGDLDGVAAEKASLGENLREGGVLIVNGESDVLAAKLRRRRRRGPRLVRYGRCDGVELRATRLSASGQGVSFRVNDGERVDLPIPGEHNVLNALAAVGVARELGVHVSEAAARLAAFQPPSMRLEVHRWGAVTLINDAYNANPASMASALEVLSGWDGAARRVFVSGEMRELGDVARLKHQELGRRIAEAGVDVLVAVGGHAETVARATLRVAPTVAVTTAADTDAASRSLDELIRPGDVVLLKGSRAVGLEALVEPIRALAERMDDAGSVRGGD